jgi:xanthosine utilization system XapX-like protein
VKLALLALVAGILAVVGVLAALMMRRDEPAWGMVALIAALCAGFAAVGYTGVE